MSTVTIPTDRFVELVEAGAHEQLVSLYTEDALFDAHVPNWRFQRQGPQAIVQELTSWFGAPGRFSRFDVEPTVSGDLLIELEWRQQEGTAAEIHSREAQRWRLDDAGRIAEQVVYCAGRWDLELIAQMAEEAPLVRP